MPLKISLILAHPDPNSFNHAVAKTTMEALVSNGHTVWFHDLCREKFYPLLPAQEFSQEAQRTACLEEVRQTVSDYFPRLAYL